MKTKRLLSALLSLALVFSMIQPLLSAFAYGESTDFVIENSILTKYTGTDSNVTIPDSVTIIGEAAFDGNTHINSVYIPESVTEIRNVSFANCTNLSSVIKKITKCISYYTSLQTVDKTKKGALSTI